MQDMISNTIAVFSVALLCLCDGLFVPRPIQFQYCGILHWLSQAATYANGSNDMPERNVNEDLKAIEDMMARKVTGVDFVKALDRAGFPDVAHNIYNMLRQKVAGDYLHTASIFDEQFHVLSAVNVPNEYHGPMTGYQISEERWNQLKNIPNAIRPEDI